MWKKREAVWEGPDKTAWGLHPWISPWELPSLMEKECICVQVIGSS